MRRGMLIRAPTSTSRSWEQWEMLSEAREEDEVEIV